MGFMQLVALLSLALPVVADETCDADLGGHDLLKLYEMLDGEGCNAEQAVAAIGELWNKSTSMHETYDHLAKVELDSSNWTESCTLCVQPDSCHLPSETLHCHTHPDLHFLAEVDKAGMISAKNFWDSVKCNSCKFGMMGMGGAIQIALDATPEAIAELGVFGAIGAGLKAIAQKEGKSLAQKAMETEAMKKALTGLAATLATIMLHMNLIKGLDQDETRDCMVAIELDALPLIISTAGQALIPTVLGAIGDMACCTGNIKEACNKKRDQFKPIDPPPPTTTTTTPRTRVVVLYKEAEEAGKTRAKTMSEEERDRKTDDELWAEAMEAFGGVKKADSEPSAMAAGPPEACATNRAIPKAHGEEEINRQQKEVREWTDCQCLWFCQVWTKDPRDCHKRIRAFREKERQQEPLCPGAWWLSLRPPDKCAEKPPKVYGNNPETSPQITVTAKGVQVTISFGGQTGKFLRWKVPPGVDFHSIGFDRALKVKEKLPGYLGIQGEAGDHFVYIDREELSNMDGNFETDEGSRNCYWASYYKSAMQQSKLMIYLVDEAWLGSKYCAQELFWAIGEEDPDESPPKSKQFQRKPLPVKAYEEYPKKDQRIHLFAWMDENPFKDDGCQENKEIRLSTINQCVKLPENSYITECHASWDNDYESQLKDCVFEKVKSLVSEKKLNFDK